MVCSIAIITALFFGLNFNGPMTNSFSLQFNGIAFAVVIVIFTIIAYIKAE